MTQPSTQYYNRIYFYHIRKAGGTSINHMFIGLSTDQPGRMYSQMSNRFPHSINLNGKVYVGWNIDLINEGNYFYAFSHAPAHTLNLPPQTYTITCFRDPVRRVMSHYNMLMDYVLHADRKRADYEKEAAWLGSGFDDFINRIPPKHLYRQLFMFSPSMNIIEALENIARVNFCLFLDEFDRGISELNDLTGLALKPIHKRKSRYKSPISDAYIMRLRHRLQPEYIFIDALKRIRGYIVK